MSFGLTIIILFRVVRPVTPLGTKQKLRLSVDPYPDQHVTKVSSPTRYQPRYHGVVVLRSGTGRKIILNLL